jgi:nitrogen regulatory protein PII 1
MQVSPSKDGEENGILHIMCDSPFEIGGIKMSDLLMIRAVVRPEKSADVLAELLDAGYVGVTKEEVYGRGRQKGIVVGEVHYDELPKELLIIIAEAADKEDIVRIIMKNARTGENGNFGDGRIFINKVEEAYTISSGKAGL